jgi:7,8-dihydropterin-6-yl-methyl-4-(beta-D-ribofuranosyl)aminobenzene 5'-phosphate synthase
MIKIDPVRRTLEMIKIFLYLLAGLVALAALAFFFFVVRQMIARAEVEREWQAVPAPAPHLESTTRLEILPLYEEDRVEQRFDFGHGVSYLIRTDSATILLDVGNNPNESPQLPAAQNMQTLGISWKEIDSVVISHPHPDHMGGVNAWQDKTISLGGSSDDLSQMSLYVPSSITYPGGTPVLSSEPTLIGKDIGTTGAISYTEVFPISLFTPKGYEQALVIHVAGQGLVMITGCGHPGMERLVSRAEALYGEQVVGVVGGLHYEKVSMDEAQPHIQFLEPRQPKLVALSPHDSSPEALEAFQSAFGEAYRFIRVGEAIQFP